MILNKITFNLSKTLIVLFPLLLITGPFLSDLSCVIISIFFLIFLLKNKKLDYLNNSYFYFFFALYIYININSVFSFNINVSLAASMPFIRIILFIFALSFFLKKYKNLNLIFFYIFVFCIFILLLDSIYQSLYEKNIIGYPLAGDKRVSSFFGKKLIMGSYVVRLLPVILGISFLLKIEKRELFQFFILLTSFVLVILSSERLAFIYFAFILIFYLFLNYRNPFSYCLVACFIFLLILLSIFYKSNFNRIIHHSIKQYKEAGSLLGLSFRHQTHYSTAYKMFLDKKIFGHGINTFRVLCGDKKYSVFDTIKEKYSNKSPVSGQVKIYNDYSLERFNRLIVFVEESGVYYEFSTDKKNHNYIYVIDGQYVEQGQLLFLSAEYINGCNTHPHNIYLQFLSELGLVGLLFFGTMFLYICYKIIILVIKSWKKEVAAHDKAIGFFLLGTFLNMFPLLPSGNYFNNWLLIITYIPIGFYLSLINLKNGK
jgi:O-antigen ligase